MRELVNSHIEEHRFVLDSLQKESSEKIIQIANEIVLALRSKKTIFWCGNGGSASDSQHMAAELIGRFNKSRMPLKSIALNADTSAITCIANDFGYDEIFSRQLDGLGSEGDILLPISTSGNSKNIVNAIKLAKTKKISTFALLGKGGGEAAELADKFILVNSNTTARVQEMHITIGHILCDLIEEGLGLK
jgi:D-sedoheptulose 7-phosphate isomerase|tara:strand:+ start:124 stop:696 length:573 start_codon:yes stop_codon:yes gene_type:complete